MTLAVRSAASISECGTYRFTLTRSWDRGSGRACWVMLNPSTADHLRDDPTVRLITKFSIGWGYRELVVVNLYPFRSSTPDKCRWWADWERNGPDWYARDVLHQNAGIVAREARAADITMLAWGAAPWAWDWAQYVLEEHLQAGEVPLPRLYCLGRTKNGSPKHPLARGQNRISPSQRPIPFEVPA